MMSVPGFQKRGGGMMILSRFCYKLEDVDCRYCLHYCYDLCQQEMYRQEHPVVGRVTFASGEQQEFTDSKALLQAIREELPFRSTTSFRFETLTDDPEVKKAVDDILLDFAGEDNSRRPCNYGLTETGKQALRKAADPSIPHTYAWFVMTDTNTPQEIIRQDLTLEEAIQIYQDSNTSEKRLGVIKDGTGWKRAASSTSANMRCTCWSLMRTRPESSG